MKKYFFIFAVILLCIVASCHSSDEKGGDAKRVSVDMEGIKDYKPASEILDSTYIELIRLSSDNALIGKIEDIQISDNRIFILTESRSSILVFDEEGRLALTIDRYGNAGDEYSDITDFCVAGDIVYILDQHKQRIHKLSADGNYIDNIDIASIWGNQLFVADKDIFVINERSDTELGKYHLFKVSADKIQPYIPFKTPAGLTMQRSHSGNYVFVRENNKLYRIKNGAPEEIIFLDFGSLSLPEKYINADARELMAADIVDKYVLGVDKLQHSGDNLFFHCDVKGFPAVVVYNVKTGRIVDTCLGFWEDMFYGIGLDNYVVCDGYLYDVHYADELCTMLDNYDASHLQPEYKAKKDELRASIKADNNPIIFKYRITL